MFLVVGLGNPGDKYAGNRHNIGFMAIDEIASHHGFKPFRKKFQGQMSEGEIDGQKVVLLKPHTYMNESGVSVKATAKFFKIPPARVIVFHDELDLKPADIRVKHGGGLAGHNGLKSMKAHFGTPDFTRVRMGIGHPGEKNRVSGYVLSDFGKAEQEWVDNVCTAVAKECAHLLDANDNEFTSRVAQAV